MVNTAKNRSLLGYKGDNSRQQIIQRWTLSFFWGQQFEYERLALMQSTQGFMDRIKLLINVSTPFCRCWF
ncbi:hypothetical protein AD951_07205 [Acetobacter malorum]|uniref:Uncharacterized protein n=1 Tax=Acetobacter malorum TaxID=178901 RepID=A0A149UN77_9PROT|nr:hypothetical protein AD951_07205 [Acetobacter malorum]